MKDTLKNVITKIYQIIVKNMMRKKNLNDKNKLNKTNI